MKSAEPALTASAGADFYWFSGAAAKAAVFFYITKTNTV